MLDKTYDHAATEQRLYALWEQSGAFRPGGKPGAAPFTIVIPPPNVTGSLHMGHALNNTIQDILIRYWRMKGRDTLWQPGTDHAGIATQMVVERLLQKENKTDRRTMGREAFIARVWEWKAHSGGLITQQLRRLGASCDWSRERFTMDEGLSRAVLKVFVQLYRDGLIYKDKRLVNWDPKLLTAISDLEVQPVEIKGSLWHFRYPVEGTDRFITVRPFRLKERRPVEYAAGFLHECLANQHLLGCGLDGERVLQSAGDNVVQPRVKARRAAPQRAMHGRIPPDVQGCLPRQPAHLWDNRRRRRRQVVERQRGARDARGLPQAWRDRPENHRHEEAHAAPRGCHRVRPGIGRRRMAGARHEAPRLCVWECRS